MEVPHTISEKIQKLDARLDRLESDSHADRDMIEELKVRVAERTEAAKHIRARIQDLEEANAAWLEYMSGPQDDPPPPENGQLLPVNLPTAERVLGVLKSTGRHMTSEEIHKALPDVAARNTIHVALSKHKRLGHVLHDEDRHLYALAPKALP